MNQLQKNLLTMLHEIDGICKKHGIEYYLAGGTALGAVRAGGFLPWDDDVDLYITRDNWNRLVKVMEKELLPHRDFVCVENDDKYCNPIGRYVNTNTTFFTRGQMVCGRVCGQYIDFLIMDPMPLDEKQMWEHRKSMKLYVELLAKYYIANDYSLTLNKDFIHDDYQNLVKLSKTKGLDKILRELKEKFTKFPEEEAENYCMRWGKQTLIYKKAYYGNSRLEKFEDGVFPIGEKAECIFRTAYGDGWMYIPQKNDMEFHDGQLDLETPFKTYKDLFMPKVNLEKVIEAYDKKKYLGMKARPFKEKADLNLEKARCILAGAHIKLVDFNKDKIRESIRKRDFDFLNSYFHYFYHIQGLSTVKNNLCLIPTTEDYVRYAILNKIYQGEYYKVKSIVDLIRDNKNLQDVISLYDYCKSLSVAIYDEKSVNTLEPLLDKEKDLEDKLPDYNRAKACYLANISKSKEDYKDLIRYVEKSLDKFPDDGELLGYKGFCQYKLDDLEGAKKSYEKGMYNSRNGFLWKFGKLLCGLDGDYFGDNERNSCIQVSISREIAKKVQNLIEKLDEICKDNGFNYVAPKVVENFISEGKGLETSYLIKVNMLYDDARAMAEIINKSEENYYVEYFENNIRAKDFEFRLCDLNTTMLNLDISSFHNKKGIYISILPVAKINGHDNRLIRFQNKVLRILSSQNKEENRKKRFVRGFIIGFVKLIGIKNLKKMIVTHRDKYYWENTWSNQLIKSCKIKEPEVINEEKYLIDVSLPYTNSDDILSKTHHYGEYMRMMRKANFIYRRQKKYNDIAYLPYELFKEIKKSINENKKI